ncbi:beta-ketoacyl-[acyl-carrier-protein] synthase family protein, partial [Jatrophihabitans sp. YIM 134969]
AAGPRRLVAAAAVDPAAVLGAATSRRLDRHSQLALVAAREAWADAGRPDVDPWRLAVVVGTGVGGGLTTMAQHDVLVADGPTRMSPFTVPMLMPNAAAAAVSTELGARAGAHTPSSACAAGAEAISLAADLIRAGRCDVAVAGGTEACIHPFSLGAFSRMGALSTRTDDPAGASRPFDTERDGFVMAEGAALVVLQRADSVGASQTVRGRLLGSAVTSDARDLVAPTPEGQIAAMTLALRDAEIGVSDVGWVQAHATSTPKGDPVEAGAIARVLGSGTTVTATKSMTGHLLGASGSLGAVATLLSLRDRVVPAVRNLVDLDSRVDLDVVRGGLRRLTDRRAALCNAFGFGGHNVSLAFAAATG